MLSSPTSLPLITAHRGASHDAPENTLAALRLGFAQGADAGECDVRLTADGHAILLHDADTRRVAGRGRTLSAARETLAALQALDVGKWKGAEWSGEKIPTLESACAVVPPGRRLLIEIKCGVEILPAIERAFAIATHPPAAFILMSFELAVVAAAKRRFPAIEVHWIVERDGRSAAQLAAAAREADLDGVNLDRRFPLDAEFVAVLHAAGLKVHVWTVDDAGGARGLVAAGVDSITTNRPGWLREQLTVASGS